MATKRSHHWVDYDSDDSDTAAQDTDRAPASTTAVVASTPASAAALLIDNGDIPQPKRRRVNAQQQPSSSLSSLPVAATLTKTTTAPAPSSTSTTTLTTPTNQTSSHRDRLSPLPNELLIRILSFLPLRHLLFSVAPVSRRFYHLAADSQLWKALYYARFVLPRAMRIPGFRDSRDRDGGTGNAGLGPGPDEKRRTGGVGGGGGGRHKLHYSGRRTLWVDGRRGGVVVDDDEGSKVREGGGESGVESDRDSRGGPSVNWKRQFKIRYNWSKGKCAVEELRVGGGTSGGGGEVGGGVERKGRRMLVKVVEGIALTADESLGLRAWNLKTRKLVAQVDTNCSGESVAPSCIAIDEKQPDGGVIDVALGFVDGSFGVWRFSSAKRRIEEKYRHEKSSNGELVSTAFSYPYLLTATQSVLVSLYTFDVPDQKATGGCLTETRAKGVDITDPTKKSRPEALPSPYLLTSLKSHTSRPPLALSIRKMKTTTIASIAYTFSTRLGWSIGVQDLHIRPSSVDVQSTPEITATRIAYSTPMDAGGAVRLPPSPPQTPRGQHNGATRLRNSLSALETPPSPEPGPTSLCYTHPYLLATLPDNTLVLHMCTSNASSLSISNGIRLWGHTSGISDAEITARGKAVSVSTRGEEMRVWELEGRPSGIGSRSVEIRPDQSPSRRGTPGSADATLSGLDGDSIGHDWEERRNWVGFDDEMVIVLKEKKGGSESLMVYDFT